VTAVEGSWKPKNNNNSNKSKQSNEQTNSQKNKQTNKQTQKKTFIENRKIYTQLPIIWFVKQTFYETARMK